MNQKKTYNGLLLQYKKYVLKLERFEKEDKNQHRQKVLKNHIARLLIKLRNLLKKIQQLSAKEIAFASFFLCGMTFTTPLTAQSFAAKVENPFGLTDTGNYSTPTLADLDGDGDLDLMSGSEDGNFVYFQNIGTSSAPAFATKVDNPFGLSVDIGDSSIPTLADLDGDGDLDLMSGEKSGTFHYFANTGTSSAPAFGAEQNNPFGLGDIGAANEYSHPALADLDNDDDLDLISGRSNGNFAYFANTGSSSAPAFATKVDNPFGLGDIGFTSSPALADLDGDGDLDLMSGKTSGEFVYFENTGSSSAPAFGAGQNNPFELEDTGRTSTILQRLLFLTGYLGPEDAGSVSSPFLVDLDGDGDFDLMSGKYGGTFVYFKNTSATASVGQSNLSGLYYNSTNGTLNNPNGILLKNGSIFDITGRELQSFRLESLEREQEIPVFSNLPQGIYILKIDSDFGVLALKILVD